MDQVPGPDLGVKHQPAEGLFPLGQFQITHVLELAGDGGPRVIQIRIPMAIDNPGVPAQQDFGNAGAQGVHFGGRRKREIRVMAPGQPALGAEMMIVPRKGFGVRGAGAVAEKEHKRMARIMDRHDIGEIRGIDLLPGRLDQGALVFLFQIPGLAPGQRHGDAMDAAAAHKIHIVSGGDDAVWRALMPDGDIHRDQGERGWEAPDQGVEFAARPDQQAVVEGKQAGAAPAPDKRDGETPGIVGGHPVIGVRQGRVPQRRPIQHPHPIPIARTHRPARGRRAAQGGEGRPVIGERGIAAVEPDRPVAMLAPVNAGVRGEDGA